jgi:hypothetical protein
VGDELPAMEQRHEDGGIRRALSWSIGVSGELCRRLVAVRGQCPQTSDAQHNLLWCCFDVLLRRNTRSADPVGFSLLATTEGLQEGGHMSR